MCYYTQQNASIEDLKRRFNAELDNEETYLQSDFINGFSHPNIPVILNSSPHAGLSDLDQAGPDKKGQYVFRDMDRS